MSITAVGQDSGISYPGVVINHIPQTTGKYIGSPSICILPDGIYLASHDEFGPKSSETVEGVTHVFSSSDKGQTWKEISVIHGMFWGNLFWYEGAVYIMGPSKGHGNLVIRRSDDKGRTWTVPADSRSGLICEGQFHTAPMPMVIYRGRIWRAVENASSPDERWPQRYSAMIFSARLGSDLLNAENWRHSNFVTSDSTCLGGHFKGWLEGNAVIGPDGKMYDMLRCEVDSTNDEYAAFVKISRNGKEATFDRNKGFIKFPGGSKKFTIRFDNQSGLYWTLTNPKFMQVPRLHRYSVRNMLALCSSTDLVHWTMHKVALFHPERWQHAYQYVDWLVEGDDIVFVSRTAMDDNAGGAHSFHDANYLTFHRIKNFRSLAGEKLDLNEYVTDELK